MNKKKIGVYLEAEPSAGGIFQYALSIIDAINNLDKNKFETHFFVNDRNWSDYIDSDSIIHLNAKPNYLKILNRLFRITLSFKVYNKYAYIFNKSIKNIDTINCDIVIYPSQDSISYQTKSSALTAIHDLMHRYEPHFDEYQNGVYEKREKHYSEICKKSKGILVDSELGKKHVMESYIVDTKKVYVLPFVPPFHLNNIKSIDIIEKYKLNPNYIFYPAQFWEHKNHKKLIDAFRIIIDKKIDLQLVLVGSKKNNYSKIIKKIKDLNLVDDIKVLGYVSDQDLVSLYKKAIAMVFPSLIGPTNIPPIEALILDCPLIVSNAYAMPEQVGDAALLFDPKDENELVKCIEKVFFDIKLRGDLISKGKKQTAKWTLNDFNNKLKEIIIDVTNDD